MAMCKAVLGLSSQGIKNNLRAIPIGFTLLHCLTPVLHSAPHALPVAALSTTLSTAALDKHPQSKERGITLDLGFSCFTVSNVAQSLLGALLLHRMGHMGSRFRIRTLVAAVT